MKINNYLKLPYTIEIVPVKGGYFATVKELSGCMSEGRSREEALINIYDAMRAWIEVALQEGVKIPLPKEDTNGLFKSEKSN